MTLAAGSTLQNGRYVIQSVISQSEIDITYAAKHTYLDQAVRIKTLQPRLRSHYEDVNLREEFTHRAARFARSGNPHLMRVIDGFEEDWMPFLVLKTVPGMCLTNRLQHIALHQIVEVMRQLVPAVQFLHDQNLVHGDICLDNIVVRQESAPDTLDVVLTGMRLRSFMPSLAQAIDGENPQLLLPQSDRQHLAILLCELLTGQTQSLVALQSGETLSGVRSRYPQLAESLNEVLVQGLNLEDAQSVSDWFSHLDPLLSQAIETPAPATVPAETPTPSAQGNQTAEQTAAAEWADRGDRQITHSADPNLVAPDAADPIPQSAQTPSMETFPDTVSEPTYSEVGHSSSGDSSTMTATRPPHSASAESSIQSSSPARRRSWKIPVALGLTSLIAVVGGGYFGLTFRLQEPEDLERSPIFGREIFGSEQSFPTSDNWPGESDYDGRTRSPLFESPNTLQYSRPSTIEFDEPVVTPRQLYESQPSQTEPAPVEEEAQYEFRDDVNLSTGTETFPTEDLSIDNQESNEGDRPAASPPAAQPEPAPPPPPPSASSNSSLDILIAPSPSNIEPPAPTQLNAVPKPTSNTNSL